MSFIDKNLMAGETVVYRTKLHWIIFIWPLLGLAYAIGCFASNRYGWAAGVGVFSVGFLFDRFISYISAEFGVTDKRVLIKVGLIRRRSLELLLSKIEAISVDQGIIGRIFGYGTIVVSGSGGTKEPFARIANALDFRRKVQEKIT